MSVFARLRPRSAASVLPSGMVPADQAAAQARRNAPAPVPPGPPPHPDLVAQRDRLVERFTAMQADLGGVFYEMAIRDHVRMDVLTKKAAELQRVDAELAEVQRALRGDERAGRWRLPILRDGTRHRCALLLALRLRAARPGRRAGRRAHFRGQRRPARVTRAQLTILCVLSALSTVAVLAGGAVSSGPSTELTAALRSRSRTTLPFPQPRPRPSPTVRPTRHPPLRRTPSLSPSPPRPRRRSPSKRPPSRRRRRLLPRSPPRLRPRPSPRRARRSSTSSRSCSRVGATTRRSARIPPRLTWRRSCVRRARC